MQLEIKTEGVDFVVSRAPQPKNDAEGRQKADRETGALLHVTELVTMDATGVEVIKVTTTGEPKLTKQQFVTVLKRSRPRGPSRVTAGWPSTLSRSPQSPPPRRPPLLRGRP